MENKERNFLKEFNERAAKIDQRPVELETKILTENSKVFNIAKEGKKFNIHKRSLPPEIDKIVVFGVTKEEAEWLLNHNSKNLIPLLKSKLYQDDSRETKTLIYYDVIPVGATAREKSIYYNAPEIIKGE